IEERAAHLAQRLAIDQILEIRDLAVVQVRGVGIAHGLLALASLPKRCERFCITSDSASSKRCASWCSRSRCSHVLFTKPRKVSATPAPCVAVARNVGSLPIAAMRMISSSLRMLGRSRLLYWMTSGSLLGS